MFSLVAAFGDVDETNDAMAVANGQDSACAIPEGKASPAANRRPQHVVNTTLHSKSVFLPNTLW